MTLNFFIKIDILGTILMEILFPSYWGWGGVPLPKLEERVCILVMIGGKKKQFGGQKQSICFTE